MPRPRQRGRLARERTDPVGRFGLPEDIVYAALFLASDGHICGVYAALYLASDESRWMTGTEFVVDGGIRVNYF